MAVSELGSIAQQSGVPVSLHGTGGAWMIVGEEADRDAATVWLQGQCTVLQDWTALRGPLADTFERWWAQVQDQAR